MTATVLLIDDDPSLRRVTEYNLAAAGFTVLPAASGAVGLTLFRTRRPDLVITDVRLGDMDGLAVLAAIKEENSETPVIVITAFGSIELAVQAMQKGAFTFLTKPFDREALRLAAHQALELASLRVRNQALTEELDRLAGVDGITTSNPAMAEILETAVAVAASEATVLITGESGTGKELLARLIHRRSPRRDHPLVAVNCSAIPPTLIESELFGHKKGAFTGAVAHRKGRFQTANHGTLFLDEVGELRPDMQAKLLRGLQEREVEPVGADRPERVDVRIIAATNRDLEEAIRRGEVREDLFYRLSVIHLHLPPLRERREDIPALTRQFLDRLGAPPEVRFSESALARMHHYAWPGNIRELQNVVERCLILRKGPVIEAGSLQLPEPAAPDAFPLPEIPDEGISLEAVERALVEKALAKAGNNRSEAARLLKIPRHVLLYRLAKFGL
ncbi:MAG: sigma-54 dependent transcriptional regulator [Thermodesulfobacteriota bacterium]